MKGGNLSIEEKVIAMLYQRLPMLSDLQCSALPITLSVIVLNREDVWKGFFFFGDTLDVDEGF